MSVKNMKLQPEYENIVNKIEAIKPKLMPYAQKLLSYGEYNNFTKRFVAEVASAVISTDTRCEWYNKYSCTDENVETLVKAALQQVCPEVLMLKKYYNVTYTVDGKSHYSSNIAHAESAEAVRQYYEKEYPGEKIIVSELSPGALQEALWKGNPLVEINTDPGEPHDRKTPTKRREEPER